MELKSSRQNLKVFGFQLTVHYFLKVYRGSDYLHKTWPELILPRLNPELQTKIIARLFGRLIRDPSIY